MRAFGPRRRRCASRRFTDEELKHQELFRRIEQMVAASMPPGYRFDISANDVAGSVLGRCTWAVLALTCHIELFSQAHYRASIGDAQGLSPLFKDVFLFHWKEESQHAIIDELEWMREDAKLSSVAQRDAAVDDLIALVGGVDGILQAQARADAAYFLDAMRLEGHPRAADVHATVLKACRWQYIVSGAIQPRFQEVLASLVNDAQVRRIQEALAPLMYAVPAREQVARAMTHRGPGQIRENRRPHPKDADDRA